MEKKKPAPDGAGPGKGVFSWQRKTILLFQTLERRWGGKILESGILRRHADLIEIRYLGNFLPSLRLA